MDERKWGELYERTQYDDEEPDDSQPLPVPEDPAPEELERERDPYVPRRRARWYPIAYRFPSGRVDPVLGLD